MQTPLWTQLGVPRTFMPRAKPGLHIGDTPGSHCIAPNNKRSWDGKRRNKAKPSQAAAAQAAEAAAQAAKQNEPMFSHCRVVCQENRYDRTQAVQAATPELKEMEEKLAADHSEVCLKIVFLLPDDEAAMAEGEEMQEKMVVSAAARADEYLRWALDVTAKYRIINASPSQIAPYTESPPESSWHVGPMPEEAKRKVGKILMHAAKKLPVGAITDWGINSLVESLREEKVMDKLGVAVLDVVWSWMADDSDLGAASMVPELDLESLCEGSSRRTDDGIGLGVQRCGWRRTKGATEDFVENVRLIWLMMRHLCKMILGKDLEETGKDLEKIALCTEPALVMPDTGTVEIAQALWSNLSKEFTNVGKTKDDMYMLLEIMRRKGAVTGPLVIKKHSAAWIVNTQLLQDEMHNVNMTMKQEQKELKVLHKTRGGHGGTTGTGSYSNSEKKKQKEEKEKKEQKEQAAVDAAEEKKKQKEEKEKKEQKEQAAVDAAKEKKKQKEEKEKKEQEPPAAAAATAEEKKKQKEEKELPAAAAAATEEHSPNAGDDALNEAQSVVVAEAGPQLNRRRPQGGAAGSPKRVKLPVTQTTQTSNGCPGLNGTIVLFSSSSLRGVEAKIISTKDDTKKQVLRYVYHTIHIPCACPPCTLRL